jgi:Fuseless
MIRSVWIDNSNDSVVSGAMQFRVSVPNERSYDIEKDCAKVKEKWRERNFYQDLASIVLIPFVIVAFWRGSWNLMDTYHQFFPNTTVLIVSALLMVTLELIRSTFISKRLKILDDDTCFAVLQKNVFLSFFDIIYNFSNVVLWRVLWGHEGNSD